MATATTHEWASTLIGSTGLAAGGCTCGWSLVGRDARATHAATVAHSYGAVCDFEWEDAKYHFCKLPARHAGDHLCVSDAAEYETGGE